MNLTTKNSASDLKWGDVVYVAFYSQHDRCHRIAKCQVRINIYGEATTLVPSDKPMHRVEPVLLKDAVWGWSSEDVAAMLAAPTDEELARDYQRHCYDTACALGHSCEAWA